MDSQINHFPVSIRLWTKLDKISYMNSLGYSAHVHLVKVNLPAVNDVDRATGLRSKDGSRFRILSILNSLPNDNTVYLSKLKAFAHDNSNVLKLAQFVFVLCRKHGGNRKKCRFPAFSAFSTMFPKTFSFMGL